MKKSKFTEAQIAFALRQTEQGTRVAEICRKMGISDATFYDLDLNQCEILHFFNTISLGTNPWVVTAEDKIPRWGRCSKRQLVKGLSYIGKKHCKKVIAFSQQAFKTNLVAFSSFPRLGKDIIEKMEVILPSQKPLISSYEEKILDSDHLVCTIIGGDFFRKGRKEVLLAFEKLLKRNRPVKLNIVSKLQYGDYASKTTKTDFQKALSIIDMNNFGLSNKSELATIYVPENHLGAGGLHNEGLKNTKKYKLGFLP